MNELNKGIFNFIVRGSSLGLKFLAILLMPSFFGIELVGDVGLYLALISYGVLLFGFDFYINDNRRYVPTKDAINSSIFSEHFSLLLLTYSFLFLLLFLLGLDAYYLLLFAVASEHLSQELVRILNTLNDQIKASFLIFIRVGLWSIALLLSMVYNIETQINQILYFWIIFNGLSIFFGLIWLGNYLVFSISLIRFNPRNVFKKIKKSLNFFIGTIALKFTILGDKLFLENYASKEELGIYVYYFTIGSIIINVIEPILIAIKYPIMIKAYREGEFNLFKEQSNDLIKKVIIMSILMIALLHLMYFYLGSFLVENHMDNILIFSLCAIFGALSLCNMALHFILYSSNNDNDIIRSNFIGFGCVIILLVSISEYISMLNVIAILILSYLTMILFKATIILRKRLLKI